MTLFNALLAVYLGHPTAAQLSLPEMPGHAYK